MKNLLRSFVINIAALQIAIMLIPGTKNTGSEQTLIFAILVLSLINLLIRPIISLLLLPINLITLGSFRWLINVAVLYILSLIVSELKIQSYTFSGFNYQGFIIPNMNISKFWTLVFTSATISISNAFLFWLAKEN